MENFFDTSFLGPVGDVANVIPVTNVGLQLIKDPSKITRPDKIVTDGLSNATGSVGNLGKTVGGVASGTVGAVGGIAGGVVSGVGQAAGAAGGGILSMIAGMFGIDVGQMKTYLIGCCICMAICALIVGFVYVKGMIK